MANETVEIFDGPVTPLNEIKQKFCSIGEGEVELDFEGAIGIIRLDQRSKRNAISGKMMARLEEVVTQLEQWKDGKGVILRGSGGHFCSGGDLDFARSTGNARDGFDMATLMHDVLSRFKKLPLISVALIQGAGALGGGAELSTACDFRLITNNCNGIGFVHAKLGIVPAWGGTSRLVQIIGQRKALNLISTAEILKPNACLEIGLVDEIIPSTSDPINFTLDWLRVRTRFEMETVRALKYTISNLGEDCDGDKERRIFAPLWGGAPNKTALQQNIKHK